MSNIEKTIRVKKKLTNKELYNFDYDSILADLKFKLTAISDKMLKVNKAIHSKTQDLIDCSNNYNENLISKSELLLEKSKQLDCSHKGEYAQLLYDFKMLCLETSNSSNSIVLQYDHLVNSLLPNTYPIHVSLLTHSPESIIHTISIFI